MKYRSQIGFLWIAAILVMAGSHIPLFIDMSSLSSIDFWTGLSIYILCDLLFLDITLDTWYEFCDDYLIVKCGIFCREEIPYEDIHRFKETRNPLASTGLSMDRLEIRYKSQRGAGNNDVLISPVRKREFIKQLEEKTHLKLTEK